MMLIMSPIKSTSLLVCAASLLLYGLHVPPVGAQPGDTKAAAEQLFSQAQQLMAAGNYDAACPKLEASMELDAALGTLINLARCYEKQGRLASAWARYREAADLAARASQGKRQRFAARQAEALEPRLPRLIIRVSSVSAVSGLSISRDESKVDAAMFDTAIYIDPGEHTIVARAPGYLDFTKTFEIAVGQEIIIEVPSLTPTDANDSAAENATRADQQQEKVSDGKPANSNDPGPPPLRRTIGLITAGTGGLALTVGLGFGWASRSAWSKAFEGGACQRETLECSVDGQREAEKAGRRADVATVLSTGGVVLMVAGAVLYFTAREPTETDSTLSVAPMLAPESMGVVMTGHF